MSRWAEGVAGRVERGMAEASESSPVAAAETAASVAVASQRDGARGHRD